MAGLNGRDLNTKELFNALDSNGHCYIIVDQSAYVGVIIPTDVVIANIAESLQGPCPKRCGF